MTLIEKILARACGSAKVCPDEFVVAKIDCAMMPESFRMIPELLTRAGIDAKTFTVWDTERFVVFIDHQVPPTSVNRAESQKLSREFATKLHIKYFYDIFCGVGHQVMMEKGHVKPGQLIVGADSHTTTYGALNAAATGIGASEMAYVIKTGELWFKVPETIRFELNGRLGDFVFPKDIMLYIAGKYGTEVAQYKAIEWGGPVVDDLTLDGRMTMANMSVELGAKFGVFRADSKTMDFLRITTDRSFQPVDSDSDATYGDKFFIDASEIEPQIAAPHSVGNVRSVSAMKGTSIDQAVIASCCDGRMEDLRIAAKLLRAKKVHPKVRFYIAPASWKIYKQALNEGILRIFLDSGVLVENPSCGLCTGYQGILAKGERCIAAIPRNFKGRLGSPDAEIFLASPATVASSAIRGKIVDPREEGM